MFLLLPHAMLFSATLIISTLAVLSASSFLVMWASLELNLMSLIPLMLMNNLKLESEAAVKYFLAQALGSSAFLISYICISQGLILLTNQDIPLILMSIALTIKLGAAPTHFWFPSVMSSASWPICIILATWQKVAPLAMITFMFLPSNKVIFLTAMMSSLVGGIMGLNQTQLTALLAYSSIGHLGWTLSAFYCSSYTGTLYFFIYAITTSSLMLVLHTTNIYSIKQTSANLPISPDKYFASMTLLLSLGGLPPFLGFIPKLMVLDTLITKLHIFLAISLIMGSALNLSYYLTLMFNLYITSKNPVMMKFLPQTNMSSSSIIITTPLFLVPLLI